MTPQQQPGLIEASKLALEFDKRFTSMNGIDVPERVSVPRDEWRALHSAIKALAAPVQEPVGVVKVLPLGDGHKPMHWADWTDADNPPLEGTLLYTTPTAAQSAVPLTDEQIDVIGSQWVGYPSYDDELKWFAREIEAAHGIKEQP